MARGRLPGAVVRTDYTLSAHTPPSGQASGQVYTACLIALKYAHRIPTVSDLRETYGMSRATAYRWIAAIKAARGEP